MGNTIGRLSLISCGAVKKWASQKIIQSSHRTKTCEKWERWCSFFLYLYYSLLFYLFTLKGFRKIIKPEKMITIKGKLKFSTLPASLPDGSLLTVKFQDTSLMDAPAKTLGTHKEVINGYATGQDLTFEIQCEKPRCPDATVSF